MAASARWLLARAFRAHPGRVIAANALQVVGNLGVLLAMALGVLALGGRGEGGPLASVGLTGILGDDRLHAATAIITVGVVASLILFAAARIALDLSCRVQSALLEEFVSGLATDPGRAALVARDVEVAPAVSSVAIASVHAAGLSARRLLELAAPCVLAGGGVVFMWLAAPTLVLVAAPLLVLNGVAAMAIARWSTREHNRHRSANSSLMALVRRQSRAYADGDQTALDAVHTAPYFDQAARSNQLRLFGQEATNLLDGGFAVVTVGALVAVGAVELGSTAELLAFVIGFSHAVQGLRRLKGFVAIFSRLEPTLHELRTTLEEHEEAAEARHRLPSWLEVSAVGVELRTDAGGSQGVPSRVVRLVDSGTIWVLSEGSKRSWSLEQMVDRVESCMHPRPDLRRGLEVEPEGPGGGIVTIRRYAPGREWPPGGLDIVVTSSVDVVLGSTHCDAVLIESNGKILGVGDRAWLGEHRHAVAELLARTDAERRLAVVARDGV